MRESELLDHIAARSIGLTAGPGWAVEVGPGDDCAVMRDSSGGLVLLTVDQLVEGRHFTAGTDLDLIARKAVARSVSDIAAMGGTPAWGLATGLLPKGYAQGDALFDAMARWARHWSCPLVGGDVATHASADHPLTLTVTIGGSMPAGHTPVLRSGARSGDQVWLTGPVGGSFESGRHLSFEPRLAAGLAASRVGSGVTAMMDLSDGLGRDSDRIARASGVVIEIEASLVPLHAGVRGWRQGISEGEDYELVLMAAAPPQIPGLLGPIGRARACVAGETPGAFIVEEGTAHSARDLGWDH